MDLQTVLPWLIFAIVITTMMALDLGVFHRKSHAVSVREATIWTATWVTLALLFAVGVFFLRGRQSSLEFLTGYVIEYSLSVDNIFVFVLIFTMFRVPPTAQHRVLFWGILGAFVMRGVMIGVGAALVQRFHWILYLFGAFLIYTGIKLAVTRETDEEKEIGDNVVVRMVRKRIRMTPHYVHDSFRVTRDGARLFTPLVLVLVVVESSDLMFAVDSIPAIFAISQSPFVLYTSNVFAILGLRSLYFLVAGIVDRFYYLRPALAAILSFVGVKMVIAEFYKITTALSLGVIVTVLLVAFGASILRARKLGPRADLVSDPRKIPEEADAPEDVLRKD